MPYALIAIGLIMVITAANNTHVQFAGQVQRDGRDFLKYMVAFGIVGAAGYVKDLQTLSRTFMFLMIAAMLLSNSKTGRGFLGNMQDAINQGPAPIPAPAADQSLAGTPNPASILGGADPAAALKAQQSGLFGQPPADAGQAKFNGWMNYFVGGS